MQIDLTRHVMRLQARAVQRGNGAQRQFRRVTDPSCQESNGIAEVRPCLVKAVLDTGDLFPGRENILLVAPAASIGGFHRFGRKHGFITLAFEQVQYVLLIKAVEPGARGFRTETRQFHGPYRRGDIGLPLKPVAPGVPFVAAGESLCDADRTFGHGIVGQAVTRGAGDRKTVDGKLENRVGQAARRYGSFAE